MTSGNRTGNLLVRSTNWIGDSVMSLAALRELRRLFPSCRISLLARPWVAGLFQDQDLVDEILTLPQNLGMWKEGFWIRNSGLRFDSAVLFPNSFSAALSAALARIPERIGYSRDGRGFLLSRRARPRIRQRKAHQVYYYLDLLYQAGLSSRDYLDDPTYQPDITLKVSPEGLKSARQLLSALSVEEDRPLIALNPGAYFGPAKRWMTDRYARVADALISSHGAAVVIIGSAGEMRLAEDLSRHCRHPVHILTGKTDLPCLMGLLSISRLLITNDSGPMHLAAALGVSQLALFGSTDEVATGPLGSRATVIHKHASCSPCLLRECPIDLRCFSRISVQEVVETSRTILETDHV